LDGPLPVSSLVSEEKIFEISANQSILLALAAMLNIRLERKTVTFGTKLSRNVPWMVLYKVTVFRSSRIFNMAARANNML
jgi:hypothetical protein